MEDQKTTLNALFHPRSIAIIGASDDLTRIGGLPIRFLRQHGYKGKDISRQPQIQGDRRASLLSFP